MPLYNAYVWENDDVDPHEWIVELTEDEVEVWRGRLEKLFMDQDQDEPVIRDYGVALLVPGDPEDIADYITEMRENYIDAD